MEIPQYNYKEKLINILTNLIIVVNYVSVAVIFWLLNKSDYCDPFKKMTHITIFF